MTDFNGFIFSGPRLEDIDIPRLGHEIGVGEDVLHAVMETETAGKGTDSKGRLRILYEPHVAYKIASPATRAKLVKAGLAYPKWGEKPYPADSYPRMLKAKDIDEDVALRACSWALPQVMGDNYALAGYETVQDMVADFLKDEDNQLQGMVNFIKNSGLDDELRAIEEKIRKGQTVTATDCIPFVRGYNGKGYAKNNYHTTFAAKVAKWRKIPDTPWSPSGNGIETSGIDIYDGKAHPEVLSVQTILNEIGYPEVGTVDGKWGNKTVAAILAFRVDNGLQTADPRIDSEFLAKLALRPQRPVAPARANATVSDLRGKDDAAIRKSDKTKYAVGLLGLASAGPEMIDKSISAAETYVGYMGRVRALVDPALGFVQDNIWLIGGGLTAYGLWKLWDLDILRLKKHQTAEDVSQ